MRFLQLSFILTFVAMACALPTGEPRPNKLQARNVLAMLRGQAMYIGAALSGQSFMESIGTAGCRMKKNIRDMRGLMTEEDEVKKHFTEDVPAAIPSQSSTEVISSSCESVALHGLFLLSLFGLP